MSYRANTGDYKAQRGDFIMVDPRAIVVRPELNIGRQGRPIERDEETLKLADSMMPMSGDGDAGSGQIQPVVVRPLPDRRLLLVTGFRRHEAAMVNLDRCPEYKLKCIVVLMSPEEAAIMNIRENLDRQDPSPLDLAYAVRTLMGSYGYSLARVSGQLGRSQEWLSDLVSLLSLPASHLDAVRAGTLPVSAALEATRLPEDQRGRVLDAIAAQSGRKVTAGQVREIRRTVQAETGHGGPVSRTLRQFRAFLATVPLGPSHQLAVATTAYLDGHLSEPEYLSFWNNPNQERLPS